MDEKNTPELTKVKTNRKPLFIIGLVFGILLGVVLTMLMVNWFHYRLPKNVQVNNEPPRRDTSSDTVVQYVIHKYEREPGMDQMVWSGDSSSVDSLYLEDESEDLMMDEEELEEVEKMEQQVQHDQLLWKKSVWVVSWNEEERKGESVMALQVQGWDTPIKNKMSYQFSDNVLKLKGINKESLKIYLFKDSYYLVVNHKVYPIRHNKQYEKLVETKDVTF